MSRYLKISPYRTYDDFYFKLSDLKQTWSEVLSHVETVLDDQYLENEEQLVGIKLSLEITDRIPEEVEFEE